MCLKKFFFCELWYSLNTHSKKFTISTIFVCLFGQAVQHVGLSVPQPGIEPTLLALEAQGLNH